MERTYRVSLEVDLSAMDVSPISIDDNVITFHLEVEAENACDALESAMRNFAFDTSFVSIVPAREG